MAKWLQVRARAWHILLTFMTAVLLAVIISALASGHLMISFHSTDYLRRIGALLALYFSVFPGGILIVVLLLGARGRVACVVALSPPVLVALFWAIMSP